MPGAGERRKSIPTIQKRSLGLRLESVASRKAGVHGGPPAIEALCQQSGPWEQVRWIPDLNPRQRKSRGFGPDVMVTQLSTALAPRGVSLTEAGQVTSATFDGPTEPYSNPPRNRLSEASPCRGDGSPRLRLPP